MRPHLVPLVSCAVLALLAPAAHAQVQPIGTFSWQTEPYCNVITLTVMQNGSTFTLDGFDAQCGAARVAPAVGIARVNPDGSVGLGMTIVNTPGGTPTHIDAVINLATLSGTWSDSGGVEGTFTFNGAGVGSPRPIGILKETRFNNAGAFIGARINGTPAAPTGVSNNHVLAFIGARGHDSGGVGDSSEAQIRMLANENWTPSRHGTKIDFLTTENASLGTSVRMTIDHDGEIGIGVESPVAALDVLGNVRIGTGVLGCVQDRDGTLLPKVLGL